MSVIDITDKLHQQKFEEDCRQKFAEGQKILSLYKELVASGIEPLEVSQWMVETAWTEMSSRYGTDYGLMVAEDQLMKAAWVHGHSNIARLNSEEDFNQAIDVATKQKIELLLKLKQSE